MRDEQELENMLLEVAGRPKGSEGKQPSKRRVLPAQESSSDDDDDDDDDVDDYQDYDGRSRYEDDGGHDTKGKGLKVPLKKRFDTVDKDNEDRGDGYHSDLSYGSDLYKDEEDRRQLESMSELQREMILHDRSEKRENLLKKIRPAGPSRPQIRGRNEGPPSSRMRSSVRESAMSVKADALNALVARRQRAQDTDIRSRRGESKSSREREPSSSEEEFESESSRSSREDKEEEEGDDVDHEVNKAIIQRSDGEDFGSEDEERESDDEDNNLIKSITIRRSKLLKWFMEPFFEDVIRGCFVRIGIGTSGSGLNIYRLCLVKNVDAKEPDKVYKFENRMTYKYLNCTWGDDSTAARWQMARVSDQPPTDEDIKAWKRACSGHGITTAEILQKQEALLKANSFVYSAATVKQMLQEKKQAAARPSNIALEKDRLLKQLAIAESKGEYGELGKLKEKLKELEVYSLQISSKNTKAERIEMMNRRNRIENFKNASELKPINPHAKAGEAGYDPFSRRWTRSQNYYKSDSSKAVKIGDEGKADKQKATEAVGFAYSQAGEDTSKLGNMQIFVENGAKIYNLHDFYLPISLDMIEQLGGAQGAPLAFMERKRKLEARYGVRVEDNDDRRHYLTLTVDDYKRRRGLM
ncbi:hypothetical protein O6H91_19G060000 [Diphasiastrum complanatum]|uniref:Uncharacterized protein n=1 Tax=Diphasiastrum complanatum TaxID=34168 RepID=A0ACC2AVY1_DIPCM|nr:hypothetical protein O6H91_19G060000 [Diphasiastrum complanatum]